MKFRLDTEWWRTVRFAIAEQGRTVRLISILVTVGVIAVALISIANGVALTIG
ncbi:hypothetical protein ACWEPI_26365 [Streptomyces sp. NPDC004262]